MGRLLDTFIRIFSCEPVPVHYRPAPQVEDVGMMRALGETRKGDWVETASGVRFYPLDPRAEEVSLYDVAHHLSRIGRYNGAFRTEHYSVAEHSVAMAYWMLEEHRCPFLAYQALFHDAPEAYIGDMVRPLKRNMPDFEAAEEPIYQAVVEAFPMLWKSHEVCGTTGVGFVLAPLVKEADNRILVDERAQIMHQSGNTWGIDHLEPLGVVLTGCRPSEAYHRFVTCERELRRLCELEVEVGRA